MFESRLFYLISVAVKNSNQHIFPQICLDKMSYGPVTSRILHPSDGRSTQILYLIQQCLITVHFVLFQSHHHHQIKAEIPRLNVLVMYNGSLRVIVSAFLSLTSCYRPGTWIYDKVGVVLGYSGDAKSQKVTIFTEFKLQTETWHLSVLCAEFPTLSQSYQVIFTRP